MRIAEVHPIRLAHPWKTRQYVVLVADNGRMGIGEATVGQVSLSVLGALRDIEAIVVGADPLDIQRLLTLTRRDIYADGGQIVGAAVAAVETAALDLVAQEAGLPLYAWLGGRTQPNMRLYANGWYRTERSPDLVAEKARAAVARGYTALKIDPFGAEWRTMTSRERDLSLAILSAVRAAVGDGVGLIVEAHSRFDVATACDISRRIEPLNPLWLEEPLPYTDLAGYAEVVRRSGVPIAAGESLWRLEQFVDLLTVARVAIVQFDPTHVGGLTISRAIADLALACNASIAPHSASGRVNELSCAHLVTAYPHAIVLEHFEDDPRFDDGIGSSLVIQQGFGQLQPTPGLGASFDFDRLRARHTEAVAADQNLFRDGWELRATQ